MDYRNMKYIVPIIVLIIPAICCAWTLNFRCDGVGEPTGYILTIQHPSIQKSDIDCDGDTDGTDMFAFKKQYGDMKKPDDVAGCQKCVVVKKPDGTYTCEVITP